MEKETQVTNQQDPSPTDATLQLTCIKEESLKMIKELEEKMSKMDKVLAVRREQVHESFQNLHHLLEKEERMCLAKSHELEEKAMLDLEKVVLNLTDLSTVISNLLKKLKRKNTNIKLMEKVEFFSLQLEAISDADKVLDGYLSPFQLREWRGMRHLVKPVPEPLQFDPESAHPSLTVSPDLRQVSFQARPLTLKQSKRSFDPGLYILGTPGFQSGRHYWEVHVGNRSNWIIGVVRESVQRKGVQELSSLNGFWVLRKQQDDRFYGIGLSPVSLDLTTSPMRIGVCLDFFTGHLAFYDTDTTALIFELSNCAVKEKMFAFFCPGIPVNEEDWCPLILCT
ncbi:nuclear factor 7, ovary-like [Spea bombifrons]|uniref:nuclear factor 7, ovary-like n=1 Tax=Spea bombifrons TaxID=233779 RepID=UPI0023497C57|nr:nuclear factor 7, ovary-like [Spea bombifrons]